MKTALVSLLSATLLGFASIASGRPFDAAAFISISFAIGLAAWTFEQYSRKPRPLSCVRPIHLSVTSGTRPTAKPAGRLAA